MATSDTSIYRELCGIFGKDTLSSRAAHLYNKMKLFLAKINADDTIYIDTRIQQNFKWKVYECNGYSPEEFIIVRPDEAMSNYMVYKVQ